MAAFHQLDILRKDVELIRRSQSVCHQEPGFLRLSKWPDDKAQRLDSSNKANQRSQNDHCHG